MFSKEHALPPAVITHAEELPFAMKRLIASMELPRAISERQMNISTQLSHLALLMSANAPKKSIAAQKRLLGRAQKPANLTDINRYLENFVAMEMMEHWLNEEYPTTRFVDMEAWCNAKRTDLLSGPLPSERYKGAARQLATHLGNEVADMSEEKVLKQHLTLRDATRIRCAHMLSHAADRNVLLLDTERDAFRENPDTVLERVVERMLLQSNLCSYHRLRRTLYEVLAAVFRERLLQAFGLQPTKGTNADIDNK